MTERDISTLEENGFLIKSEVKEGKKSLSRPPMLTKGILQLHYAIDSMEESESEGYHRLVHCCYVYYRILDDFIH